MHQQWWSNICIQDILEVLAHMLKTIFDWIEKNNNFQITPPLHSLV